jgi:hypothetical protein
MTLTSYAPAAFDPRAPLQPGLLDDEVLAYALIVDQTPQVLTNQRLADALLAAIYSAAGPRLLLCWTDGSLGFAWLPAGERIADAVSAAYATARASLEALHLQHAPPAAPAWSN